MYKGRAWLPVWSAKQASSTMQKGKEILGMMCDAGVRPDVITYTTLLCMCASLAEVDGDNGLRMCFELMIDLERQGLVPNRLTYNTAIDVYGKAAIAGAPADVCLEQVCIYMYVCMYVCMYECMYVCVYTYK